jgi:hypothetical protein
MFAFDTVLLESTTVDKRSQIKNYLRGVTSRTFDRKGMPHPLVLNFVYRFHFRGTEICKCRSLLRYIFVRLAGRVRQNV